MLMQKRFKAAFLCMRTHRVDFNLFFDHSLAQFVQNVEEIVRQINDIEHLNLLIQSVSNDNVTLTKYPKYDPPQYENAAALVTDNALLEDELNEFDEKINPTACKVNTVCQAYSQCLQSKPEFVLCLLCCYLKQEPACVPQALRYIRNIRYSFKSKTNEFYNAY
jgi:elongator complex protein 1